MSEKNISLEMLDGVMRGAGTYLGTHYFVVYFGRKKYLDAGRG
jgi:hypothetical protein